MESPRLDSRPGRTRGGRVDHFDVLDVGADGEVEDALEDALGGWLGVDVGEVEEHNPEIRRLRRFRRFRRIGIGRTRTLTGGQGQCEAEDFGALFGFGQDVEDAVGDGVEAGFFGVVDVEAEDQAGFGKGGGLFELSMGRMGRMGRMRRRGRAVGQVVEELAFDTEERGAREGSGFEPVGVREGGDDRDVRGGG